ncbi:MAG: 30S ribosomal protein S1 [Candidatus Cloacimonadales bacterium]
MIVNDQKEVMNQNDSTEEVNVAETAETSETQKKAEQVTPEKSETEEQAEVAKEEATEEEATEEQAPVSEPAEKTAEEEMMELFDEHFSKFKEGKIVDGMVVNVDERAVLVDIGFKSESPISIKEFSSSNLPETGDKIKVYIDSVEDGSGRLKLSKKKADFQLNSERLEKLMEEDTVIKGVFHRRVKGGMIVEVEGLEAFLPGSHISIKPIPNLDQFIGKESEFKIIKIDKERRNIIVSRKKVLMEMQEERLQELKHVLDNDGEIEGEVRNITDYGAFIDLGGIDGLLHITDMSWGHIKHPSDMLNIGDKVKVKVLSYDEENQKVSLGLKQLVPHPWENIETKYPEGSIVSGKVVNITNYGAFVEIETGVEGLVHVSEMSWTKKVRHPKQVVKMGDSIKAIVLTVSKDDHRISLGMKQMEANPWVTIDERYPVGHILEGEIKSITPFGVFVEIEENIEGLVHISDISWTKRIYHPKEVFKRGEVIKVKVLAIDATLHRIALGVKQLSNDPWDSLDERLPINTELTAKIAKVIPKGVLVDVNVDDYLVEGFVPLSHLAIPGLKKVEKAFSAAEEIPLKVIELDLENRRLILSVKAYFFGKDNSELQQFIDQHTEKEEAPIEPADKAE